VIKDNPRFSYSGPARISFMFSPERRVEHMSKLHRIINLNPGQRTRWNIRGSGAFFDQKSNLPSPEMKDFAEGQDFGVISFVDTNAQVSGLLLHGRTGEFPGVN
jgi:hypothetical protein